MHAAVVHTFGQPPTYQEVPDLTPGSTAGDEVVIEVLAAALHQRVRSQADGSHYTSTDQLPLVPGIDGVGRTPDGQLRYFVLPDTAVGSMAEHTLVDVRRTVPLLADADPIRIAAAMNPAMSSWIALRRRISFQAEQSVMVLGATGNAGRFAVQVAKRLGAGHVTAVGRDPERLATLPALGADRTVSLTGDPDTVAADLAEAGREVDMVIDYVWGDLTAQAMRAVVPARADDSQPLTWIEVGSVSGPEAAIPSAALRACRLSIVGSGQGSVSTREIVAELGELAAEITSGDYAIDARPVPLADVERVWAESKGSAERVVLVP